MQNVVKAFVNKTGVDLTGKEGHAVKFDTDGINLCSGITDQAIGVITDGGATQADVCIFGECEAKCGGTVTAGKHIIPHTDGTVKNTTSSSQEFALALMDGVTGDLACTIFVLGSNKTVS